MDENLNNAGMPETSGGDDINNAAEAVNETLNNADNALNNAANTFDNGLNNAVNTFGDAASNVADTISNDVNAAAGAMSDVTDNVSNAVNNAAETVNNGINNAAGAVNNAIQPDAVYNNGANPYSNSMGAEPQGSKTLAIISLVCGIVSILGCCCYGINLLPAIAAIITGVISKKKNQPGGGMALAGIITGAVGIVTAIIFIILLVIGLASGSGTPSYSSYLN